MKKILLFNPRSATGKPRIPNSVLQVAASIEGKQEWTIIDGNLEEHPAAKIFHYLSSGNFDFLGVTVMPGPQLHQAIPICRDVRKHFPDVKIIWGGYFPSNQPKVCLESGYVDVIVNGPGDKCFPLLLESWERGELSWENIPNIIFRKSGKIITTRKDELYDQDKLPDLPYEKLNEIYPLENYLGKTWLGTKTIAYHSSFGCPFTCSFCAVVPVYNARWKGRSAKKIYHDIKFLKEKFGGNAIEFHDNNFFVSEKRVVEFSELMLNEKMNWWGEGRIDTIDKFKDDSLALMREAGCRMIFFGAETGDDARLKKMDKGGTQTGEQILRFAERMKKFGIIPEYSFVLGTPADSPEESHKQIEDDIVFIRRVKEINPGTEIIIYMYSPVPVEGSELFESVKAKGFHFPEKLEEWISPAWEKFDLRKNPLTPWLNSSLVNRVRNFETVLNGYYPTVSDVRLSPMKRSVMKKYSALRYKSKIYSAPLGVKFLQKIWKYRQPEKEGF
ncbi:MAG: B12-binding domain-containing radical SAM protein [Bacteroidetes bacterium]|nr:B12-binding domain-containing radical SAM protein [Bacteroidota bacterium]